MFANECDIQYLQMALPPNILGHCRLAPPGHVMSFSPPNFAAQIALRCKWTMHRISRKASDRQRGERLPSHFVMYHSTHCQLTGPCHTCIASVMDMLYCLPHQIIGKRIHSLVTPALVPPPLLVCFLSSAVARAYRLYNGTHVHRTHALAFFIPGPELSSRRRSLSRGDHPSFSRPVSTSQNAQSSSPVFPLECHPPISLFQARQNEAWLHSHDSRICGARCSPSGPRALMGGMCCKERAEDKRTPFSFLALFSPLVEHLPSSYPYMNKSPAHTRARCLSFSSLLSSSVLCKGTKSLGSTSPHFV